MALTLICHRCSKVLTAHTKDELVELGQAHAAENEHNPPPSREHVLKRIRDHNQTT